MITQYIHIYVRWTFTYYLNATVCLAIPDIKTTKKIKIKLAVFLNFLNFGNPQKENWWEESFFFFLIFFEFFDFSEFWKFKKFKKNWLFFFFNFLNFLNFGNPQKENWWEESFFLVDFFVFFVFFFDFFEFWKFKKFKKNWLFFLNFLNFLNFGNPQKEKLMGRVLFFFCFFF